MSKEAEDQWMTWRNAWTSSGYGTLPARSTSKTDDDKATVTSNGQAQKAGIPEEDPLMLARRWIVEKKKDNGEQKHLLDSFLRRLFREQEEIVEHRTSRTVEDDCCLLKKIEWHIVLMLELWIYYGESFLDLSYRRILKLQNKKNAKKKKRKKKSSLPSIKEGVATQLEKHNALLDHLTNILSRAAFFLPVHETLGSFFTRRCLTKRVFVKHPKVFTHILDHFELQNPYVPKLDDEAVSTIMIVKKKKTLAKKAAPSKKKKLKLKQRPRLVDPKQRHHFRGNHFHRNMSDISKLLDHSNTPNYRSSKGNDKLSKRRSKLVTPHTDSTSKSKQEIATFATKKEISRDTNVAINRKIGSAKRSNEEIVQADTKKSKKRQLKSSYTTPEETGLMTPLANKKRQRTDSEKMVMETPLATTLIGDRTIVNETPLYLRNDKTTIVGETPIANGNNSENIVGETPCNNNTLKMVDETPISKSGNISLSLPEPVQPMKLFATLKPRQQRSSNIPPKSQSGEKKRKTSAVVAAARAYLQRNSLA